MQTFRKKERLCDFNSINTLFAEGHSFFIHPFKVLWIEAGKGSNNSVQLLISVPKRNFKRAVDRNLIKRQIRESFRHNKEELYRYLDSGHRKYAFAVVFAAKSIPKFAELDAILLLVLKRLMRELEKEPGAPAG